MFVKDLMRTKVNTVERETVAVEVTRIMNKEKIGSVIVLGAEKEPVGIITKRDLLTKCLEQCINPCDLTAADVLTTPLISISSEKAITEALTLILEKGASTLPVIDEGKLVGVITANDIFLSLQKQKIPDKEMSTGELEVERE